MSAGRGARPAVRRSPRSTRSARSMPRTAAVLAYLEAHIEQGPVLEAEGLPVGIVTGIAAQLRYQLAVDRRRRPRRHHHDDAAPRRARRRRRDGPRRRAASRARAATISSPRWAASTRRARRAPTSSPAGRSSPSTCARSTAAARRAAARDILAEVAGHRRPPRRRTSPSSRSTTSPPAPATRRSWTCSPQPARDAGQPDHPPRQRRRARRDGDGRALPDRDAVHPLRGRHQPQPGRACRSGRRRDRAAGHARLHRTSGRSPDA